MVSLLFEPFRKSHLLTLLDLTVTLGGAVLFLIFGVIYSYEAWYWDEAAETAAAALRF